MAGPFTREIREHDFESGVILRSHDVPVLVDFWAPWCGPCRVLGPILEKLAVEMKGAFELVKIDTDENPTLAGAMQIQSIPSVLLFKDGRPVDGFQGALPESDVRRMLEAHVAPTAGPNPLDDAEARLAEGDGVAAAALAERALADASLAPRAHLILARAALARGDASSAARYADAIPDDAPEASAVGAIRDALRLAESCGGGEDAARQRLVEDPSDLDARHRLGCCLAAAGRYEAALEELLEVVKLDSAYADGAARKAMLTIFGLLGTDHALSNEYRRQLAIWL